MAVKNFFSGVESEQHYNACIDAGATHVLTSYYQFHDKSDKNMVERRKKKNPQVQFMVDSGAHTFIADWTKFKHWKQKNFEDYIEAYVAWLKKNRHNIFAAVELDIDYCLNMVLANNPASTLGSSIVTSWQNKYFRPLEEDLGMQIIYVWHVERGLDGWEEMCQRHPYVGLPGEMSGKGDFNKYVTVAKRYAAKIHGFAATKQTDFRDWPWFSIDSITWKTSEMYGTLIHWDERSQRLSFIPEKDRRAKYRSHFEKHGLDADGIINDTNYKEVTKYALISMSDMEKFYERKYKDRTFYYEVRLPVPKKVKHLTPPAVLRWWRTIRGETLFQKHLGAKVDAKRDYLYALACGQYATQAELRNNPKVREFLGAYFPTLIEPLVSDLTLLQRELASFLSPPNPVALLREAPELYEPGPNHPKNREQKEFSLADLENDPVPDFILEKF